MGLDCDGNDIGGLCIGDGADDNADDNPVGREVDEANPGSPRPNASVCGLGSPPLSPVPVVLKKLPSGGHTAGACVPSVRGKAAGSPRARSMLMQGSAFVTAPSAAVGWGWLILVQLVPHGDHEPAGQWVGAGRGTAAVTEFNLGVGVGKITGFKFLGDAATLASRCAKCAAVRSCTLLP